MRSALLALLGAALPSALFPEIILKGGGVIVDSSLEKKSRGKVIKSDPAGDDIVLFENGDLMHGTFGGIQNGLLWERSDINRPILFGLSSVRQIVRKGGQSIKLHDNSSFFTLVSGDRIPGEIVSLDDKSLVIKSNVTGNLTIPRAHLRSISPNPFDGDLFYSGPYTGDGWAILENLQSKAEKEEKEKTKKDGEKGPAESSPWVHSGASFYSLGAKPLVFPEAKMPDVGRLSFRVEWKGRLNLTLALLSDFTRVFPLEEEAKNDEKDLGQDEGTGQKNDEAKENKAEEDEKEEDKVPKTREERLVDLRNGPRFQSIPWVKADERNNALTFGTGYTMTLYYNPNLYRNSFSEAGEPISKRISTGRSSIPLTDQGDAQIEIRYDRKKGLMMLYINGNYASQWSDPSGMPGNGSGFGILNTTSTARTKISEVRISSWNGMKDTAQSMTHSERDITLLTNGTDRFSGELLKIEEGVAHIRSQYLTAKIPVAEIAHIVLNESSTTDLDSEELPEELVWKEEPISILYEPFGLIKLIPTSATRERIRGTSPFLGKLDVDLSSSSVLRFSEGSPDLSDWFDDL